MNPLPTPLILAVASTFFLAGLVKGVTGMGLPTVAMGLLGTMMPPVMAAALLIVPSFVTNAVQLWEIYVVACAPAFRKAYRLRAPADLSRGPVLSLDKSGAWWNRFLMAVPDHDQPQLDQIIAVNHIRAMIHAAIEGMGALLVPRYSVLEELRRGDLVALFPAIHLAEDRFSIYQKKVKASHEKQRLLTRYLQGLSPAEFGS